MCGISGKVLFHSRKSVREDEILAMNEKIRHRGPDDGGVYINPAKTVGLGHRRLSIIDLSPAGHQPMCNEDETVWITFNGEIYNFQELKQSLEQKGHSFRSHTDTEVIIHLWEEEGEYCLQSLRGMFAFALWDEKKKQLFLARDRVGKKPLKYYLDENGIVFASEIKALLSDKDVPRNCDEEAIHHYLTLQYVPSPLTGFRHIKKLQAGHFLHIDLSASQPKVSGPTRYWRPDYSTKLRLSREEWKERILAELDIAVQLRLIADVPLGAFLSGGVDSSMIVALMARHSSAPVKTFSIGFNDPVHNELPYAQRVAKLFSTDHTEFVVQPDALKILPALVSAYEEPYADSSAIPTYYLSELTRQHVTVALNGDGGDESFAGYPWYVYQRIASLIDRIPFHENGMRAGSALLSILRPSSFKRRAKIFCATHSLPSTERYLSYFTSSYFTEEEKSLLYTDEFRRSMQARTPTRELFTQTVQCTADDPLDQATCADILSYLPDDLLVKVDIASMAHALELRSPFLDHRVVELAAMIPPEIKMKGRKTKSLLKDVCADLLPRDILDRPKKGFTVPLDRWFREDLSDFVEDTLLSRGTLLHNYIRRDAIQSLIHEHTRGSMNHGSRLWSLLTLHSWLHIFFENSKI